MNQDYITCMCVYVWFVFQVFDELQNLVNISEKNELRQRHKEHNLKTPGKTNTNTSCTNTAIFILSSMLTP